MESQNENRVVDNVEPEADHRDEIFDIEEIEIEEMAIDGICGVY